MLQARVPIMAWKTIVFNWYRHIAIPIDRSMAIPGRCGSCGKTGWEDKQTNRQTSSTTSTNQVLLSLTYPADPFCSWNFVHACMRACVRATLYTCCSKVLISDRSQLLLTDRQTDRHPAFRQTRHVCAWSLRFWAARPRESDFLNGLKFTFKDGTDYIRAYVGTGSTDPKAL